MKANDRARLTTALRDHVAKIAADLRAKMRAPGAARVAAEQLHKDERVAEDFDVWTDLLSRRAAVLWVLKSVYVRVLEDRGLLAPGRLLDSEAQQLFEKLAPNLGETAFLRWIYKDLASSRGGVPELFSPQPAEVALPSDELSRALIAFWRHRDADSGAAWSFADEHFEGELMGDLYQELDPVVKDRFALCQTPDFVRAFILDRTLTPAIETFGADEVRLLDPACGSGHFLIDGLKRLVAATAEKHADWDRARVVAHALDRVVGVDLNDYACALARTRLIMTAAELAGVTKLADAARFHPHVYWADGLEQVEREEQKPSVQFSLFEKVEEQPRATLTRSDVRAALKNVFERKFHAVVANPPYITEEDAARREYHREQVGRSRRYVSAFGGYSLSSPFTERCFQLATQDGYVGLITSNNFAKREFGKPLVEKVLARLDLTAVVDTSQAYIPHHTTPTVILFGRHRPPRAPCVRVVTGKKGEVGTPDKPASCESWVSVIRGVDEKRPFENEYIAAVDTPRSVIAKHPWTLTAGGASELKVRLERAGGVTLRECVPDMGRTTVCGLDQVYVMPPDAARRLGAEHLLRPLIVGEVIRDWSVRPSEYALYPYAAPGGPSIAENDPAVERHFWRYRSLLKSRTVFGKSPEERGGRWFDHLEHYRERLRASGGITFSNVASDNHFALQSKGHLNNAHAPVMKLGSEATEDDHYALLGILNSSVACFWMKQVFFPKGTKTHDVDKEGTLPENNRYEISTTGMKTFPLPPKWRDSSVIDLARRIHLLGVERQTLAPAQVLAQAPNLHDVAALRKAFRSAEEADQLLHRRMVFAQEELDWRVYGLYGLWLGASARGSHELDPEQRPFCWPGSGPAPGQLEPSLAALYAERRAAISATPDIGLIETVVFKRLWRGTQGVFGRYDRTYSEKARTAMLEWLSGRIEGALSGRSRPSTIEHICAAHQADGAVLAVAELLANRPDFSLTELVRDRVVASAVPSHRSHLYSTSGLARHQAWERTWADQRREDAGERITPEVPPAYGSGDFLKPDYWRLRGKLDVPKERFIAFTEVPGRSGVETLYGWAGWTAQQRVKAILAIDEELEDASVPLADRIGLLDSAWRLLPDVAREDAAAATRLKAELQALVGPDGPSR